MAGMQTIAPGTLLGGDFRVAHPLGAGGMGAVYVVDQLSTGNQRALKVMDPRLLRDAEMRERFTNEARVSARIESDHVVQVVASGVDPGSDMPWLAMELLQGENLSQNVQRCGRLHPAKVAEVVSQLCHALDAAHRVGIVHRDLKPENLFLAAPRREGIPFTLKVLDFGIAKILQGSTSSMTTTLGTPLWMAPEQTSPGANVTPATDVWAVGLIVFYMLTGHVYWRSARHHPPSITSLMREVVLDPIEPASARATELGLTGAFNPALDAWFSTCLQRDLHQRFTTATHCRDALLRVLPASPSAPQTAPPNSAVAISNLHNSPAASTFQHHHATTTGAPVLSSSIRSEPTNTSAAAPLPAPRRSLLPHLSILTCGTIVLAGIGSCVSFMFYSTYKAYDAPPAAAPRTHRVIGFDPARFDPSSFLPTADGLAREHDFSAQLVQVDVAGVGSAATMDLSANPSERRQAMFSYRADGAHRDYCSINVTVSGDGVFSAQGNTLFCGWHPVRPPKCTVVQVREKAIQEGAKPGQPQHMTYRAFDDGKAKWTVSTGDWQQVLPDDCP